MTPIESASSEGSIFNNFPFVMLVAAMLLIVTGRNKVSPQPAYLSAGLAVAAAYVLIWMFNGKRSHSLIGVLATICAMYITRLKRPSWPVLFTTAFAGSLVVAVAIGWRNDRDHDRSFAGFANFLGDFQVSKILESLNVTDGEEEIESYETYEYGGFLLMMDTVPAKVPLRLWGELPPHLLHVYSARDLAEQAALRPRCLDWSLDRRFGNGERG